MHKQISQLGIAIALVSVALSASLSGQATTRAGDPLDRRLPEFRCDDIAFAEVVRFLADVSEMSFHVDWGAVEAAGITRTTPVTVRQRKPIAVRELIGVVLQQAGGDKLAFDSQFGMVTIGTPASLQADRDTLEQRRKTAPAILLKKVQPVTYKGECLENVMRDLSLETKATIVGDGAQAPRGCVISMGMTQASNCSSVR